MTWYAVTWRDGLHRVYEADDKVWTISEDPENPGWETDGGCYGYGITRALAERIARLLNEDDERLAKPFVRVNPKDPPTVLDVIARAVCNHVNGFPGRLATSEDDYKFAESILWYLKCSGRELK